MMASIKEYPLKWLGAWMEVVRILTTCGPVTTEEILASLDHFGRSGMTIESLSARLRAWQDAGYIISSGDYWVWKR